MVAVKRRRLLGLILNEASFLSPGVNGQPPVLTVTPSPVVKGGNMSLLCVYPSYIFSLEIRNGPETIVSVQVANYSGDNSEITVVDRLAARVTVNYMHDERRVTVSYDNVTCEEAGAYVCLIGYDSIASADVGSSVVTVKGRWL